MFWIIVVLLPLLSQGAPRHWLDLDIYRFGGKGYHTNNGQPLLSSTSLSIGSKLDFGYRQLVNKQDLVNEDSDSLIVILHSVQLFNAFFALFPIIDANVYTVPFLRELCLFFRSASRIHWFTDGAEHKKTIIRLLKTANKDCQAFKYFTPKLGYNPINFRQILRSVPEAEQFSYIGHVLVPNGEKSIKGSLSQLRVMKYIRENLKTLKDLALIKKRLDLYLTMGVLGDELRVALINGECGRRFGRKTETENDHEHCRAMNLKFVEMVNTDKIAEPGNLNAASIDMDSILLNYAKVILKVFRSQAQVVSHLERLKDETAQDYSKRK